MNIKMRNGKSWGMARFLEYYRDLTLVLLQKEFTVRYKNTALGYVWSVLNPLLYAIIYLFVFKVIFKIQIQNYLLFLVSGVFFWQAFSNSVCASSSAFIGNSSLIKKVQFSRECLVLSGVLNDLTHFILSIPIIVIIMVFYGMAPTLDWLWAVPFLLTVQLLLTFGIALMVATGNLFLRDLERLITFLVMLWFYLTPIIYKEDMVPAALQWTKFVNPVAGIAINWRHLFMGEPLAPLLLGSAGVWSAAIFALGYWIYKKSNWKFAEYV